MGDRRADRLTDPDEGGWEDVEPELYAVDHGIDRAATSAEEAAMRAAVRRWRSAAWPGTVRRIAVRARTRCPRGPAVPARGRPGARRCAAPCRSRPRCRRR
ncbi:DUF5709 domain-containing protein [Geodermatophilus sp. URMC 65]